jgi:hypothetical protein
MDDETFVRQHMEVSVGASGTIWFQGLPQFGRWSEARVWLDERLKRIAEVEEEIEFVNECISAMGRLLKEGLAEGDGKMAEEQKKRAARILAREQAALDELRRGMKGLKA